MMGKDRKLIQTIVQNQRASYVALVELESLLHEGNRKILPKIIEAELIRKNAKTVKWQKTINGTYERRFIQNELLKKWNKLFERETIDVDVIKFVEYEGKIKRFVADNFSFELTENESKLDSIRFLKLSYESDDKRLLFYFSEKDNAESVLYLEFRIGHEERSITSEIFGKPVKFTQDFGLYDFLCALEQSELAENMAVFFNRLEVTHLPNKEDDSLKEKYASILQDLCKL